MAITTDFKGFGAFGASFRDIAGYEYRGGDITGCAVIDTTVPFSHGDMFSVTIKGYNYDWSAGYEIVVSGYAYAGGPSFTNYAYTLTGRHVVVRLARKIATGTISIILFETNTVLSYPQFYVTEAAFSFSGAGTAFPQAYAAGWTVTAGVTSLAAYDLVVTLNRSDNTSGIWERARTARVGEWTYPPWDNTYLQTPAGSVSNIAVTTYGYSMIGKTMFLSYWINVTVTSGSYYLSLRIPGGYTANKSQLTSFSLVNPALGHAGWVSGHHYTQVGGTMIISSHYGSATNFNGACSINGEIFFEVQ